MLVVALSLYATSFGRAMLRDSRAFPAVSSSVEQKIWIAVVAGNTEKIVRHLDDGCTPASVINMTGVAVHRMFASEKDFLRPLRNGESLLLTVVGGKVVDFKVKWMPAAQRMTLGIPLHPEQMDYDDWQALPGIGKKLAQRIESDRHKNGDFGSLEVLERVSGIGNKRIETWRKYF